MELANSIITLQPGMYILRHPKSNLPSISVSRAAVNPANNGRIEALYTSKTNGAVLRNGADCIVLHVQDGPVDLLVTAYLERAGAAVPSLKIDKIALENEAAPARGKAVEAPAKGISIIGHIEQIGDVVVTNGQRIGDPGSNSRLEGFQVMWPDKPAGVDLTYSAHVEGTGELPAVATGKFCGTRNAAERIVGLKFALQGARAGDYVLGGEVFFSGGYRAEIKSDVPTHGPTGVEHVTAFAIHIVPGAKNKNPRAPSTRTRVLNSKHKKS